MACLIKIGFIPKGKSILEYSDTFVLNNINHPLLSGIKRIETDDLRTIVGLDFSDIKETSLLPVNHQQDQETDYPTVDCDKELNQLNYDKLIYYPIQNFIKLDNQTYESVQSVAIWHLSQNTAETLIKYSQVGVGKKLFLSAIGL